MKMFEDAKGAAIGSNHISKGSNCCNIEELKGNNVFKGGECIATYSTSKTRLTIVPKLTHSAMR